MHEYQNEPRTSDGERLQGAELVAWLAEHCPGCGGPITFSADDSGGVTVNFHCPNPACAWGKP